MRRRQRLRASSRRPRAICGRVSDDASRPRLPPVLDLSRWSALVPTAVNTGPSTVIAGLDTASRACPTCGASILRNSGLPEFRAIHPLDEAFFLMDARVVSAFTRVLRRAMPAHDESRATGANIG